MTRILRRDCHAIVLDTDRFQVILPTGASMEVRLPGRAREAAEALSDPGRSPDSEVEALLDPHGLLVEPEVSDSELFLSGGDSPVLDRRDGTVYVLPQSPPAREAIRGLAALGIPTRPVEGVGEVQDASAEDDLVVVALVGWDFGRLEELNRWSLDARVPWVTGGFLEARRLTVGPLLVPGETACYRCYLDRRVTNSSNPKGFQRMREEPESAPGNIVPLAGLHAWAGSLLALEAARFMRGLAPATLATVVTIGLDRLDATQDPVLRAPRCPACSRHRHRPPLEPWTLLPREASPSRR